MDIQDVEHWLDSLPPGKQLEVFKALSIYLSGTELKRVMERTASGGGLFRIHRSQGLIRKYYVDLIRIKKLLGY